MVAFKNLSIGNLETNGFRIQSSDVSCFAYVIDTTQVVCIFRLKDLIRVILNLQTAPFHFFILEIF